MSVRSQPESSAEGLEERFRGGDEAAFDEVVRRHREAVYRMARRILGSHEDADEAAQVALLRAWQARQRFRGEASLRTWLIRIVMNVSRSMRGSATILEGLESSEAIAAREKSSEERLNVRRMRVQVRRAVAELPARQREVVLLKVFGELTYREVAGLMELSEGAVKAHLHQAVSNLRRSMAEPIRRGSS